MALVLLQVDGVHRTTIEELDPLVRDLAAYDSSFRVKVVYARDRRYGGGAVWPELLHVWLPEAGKYLAGAIGSLAVKWATGRIQERRNRRVTVNLYGPDGRIVKTVEVNSNLAVSEKEFSEPAKAPRKRRPPVDD